jgi:WD40 repeat protein
MAFLNRLATVLRATRPILLALALCWTVALGFFVFHGEGCQRLFSAPGFILTAHSRPCPRDCTRFVCLDARGKAHVWDTTTKRETFVLRDPKEDIGFVTFSPDGRRLATISSKQGQPLETRLWDATMGTELRALRNVDVPGRLIAGPAAWFSPDSHFLITSTAVWDASSGDWIADLEFGRFGPFEPERVDFPLGGSRLLFSGNGRACLWDLATTKLLASPAGGFAFSPDGQRFVGIKADGVAHIGPVGQPRRAVDLEQADAALFSADGRWLSTFKGVPQSYLIPSFELAGIGMWDAASMEKITNFTVGAAPLMEFSPDGTLFLADDSSSDSACTIWDLPSGRRVATLVHENNDTGINNINSITAIGVPTPATYAPLGTWGEVGGRFVSDDQIVTSSPPSLWRVKRVTHWGWLRPETWALLLLSPMCIATGLLSLVLLVARNLRRGRVESSGPTGVIE